MKELLPNYIEKEPFEKKVLNVAIICLYGYPQKHDSEPYAGEILKASLDKRFNETVHSKIYLLGNGESEKDHVNKFIDKLVNIDNTEIIGISIPQGTQEIAENFLLNLKKSEYKGLIVLGHALPTYLPEKFIELSPNALIVKGWGEESFGDIIEKVFSNSKEYFNIPNLTYLKDGKIVNNNIKWPEKYILPIERYPQSFFLRVEASRGCHHDKCTFCTRPLREKTQVPWVRIPPKIVLQDIKNLHNMGGNKFTFTDEDFFGDDLVGAKMIAEGIKEIGNFTFALDLRADSVLNPSDTVEKALERDLLIKTLIKAGMSFVYVGVETFSKTQLKRYGKGITPDDEIKSINKIIDMSIPMELGLITFDPVVTLDELSENVSKLESSGLWRYCGQLFNELHVFEGNPYSKIIKKFKLVVGFDSDYMTYSYKYLHSEIEQIRNVCVSLKKEVDPVYTSARNIYRTKFELPDFIEKYIINYREREIFILKKLLEGSLSYTKILNTARNNEYHNVRMLNLDLYNRSFEKNPEYNELIRNIDTYLKKF